MKALTCRLNITDLSNCSLKQRVRTWRVISSSIVKNFNSTFSTNSKLSDKKTQLKSPLIKSTKKDKQQLQSAANISLNVLGTGCNGVLYVKSSSARYLFNCGEGCQRLAYEHRQKLTQVKEIFTTTNSWDRIGGLPGIALTLQDVGTSEMTLHGPSDIDKIFQAMERFVILETINLKQVTALDQDFHQDGTMKVDYVPIFKHKYGNKSSNSPDSNGNKERKTKFSEYIMCYICRPSPRVGSLLTDRIFELGVPPGLLAHLNAGRDVKLPNGKIIRSSDVKSPDCPGLVFMVVDCPTEDYIEPFVTDSSWTKYQNKSDYNSSKKGEEIIHPTIIIHFTPEKILLDPKYVAWMESFPSTTEHLLMNDSCQSLGSEAVHKFQHKLNLIDSEIFPLLYEGCERQADPSELVYEINDEHELMVDLKEFGVSMKRDVLAKREQQPKLPIPPQLSHIKVPLTLGETMLRYNLRPHLGYDNSDVVRLRPHHYRNEVLSLDNFVESHEKFQSTIEMLPEPSNLQKYPNVLFLGTGSSVPNKGRNVSGILVETSKNNRILLDCGEGTYLQLIRFYGREEVKKVLSETNAFYVSHLHADHHLGLISLLKARHEAFESLNIPFVPVSLIAPHQLLHYLSIYNQCVEPTRHLFHLWSNTSLSTGYDGAKPIQNKKTLFDSLDLENLETVRVKHCANAFGVTLKHKSGWKLTYSGDTMPCEDLVKLGQGSDLLIHEATMEDELLEDAILKRHSTISEAIGIGRRMNAKFTILTHFSQRYAKVPKLKEELAPDVGIAFDNMLVRADTLHKLPYMYPMLKCIFAEDIEDMETKTARRLKIIEQEQQSGEQPAIQNPNKIHVKTRRRQQ